MSERFNFTGRVAIVTGAGGGLGRAHALLLAERGADVVVNDVGSAVDGSGSANEPAVEVVSEIVAAGGRAVSDTHSVATAAGGRGVVETAIETFGRLDIVVNNAGILRDRAFHNVTDDDLDAVMAVHLLGAFHVTRPAWEHLKTSGAGRIVMTSSNAGLIGNFGQSAYGAAKMGLVGLTRVLAIEGERHGIKANVVAPIARTRMTESVLGRLIEHVDPAQVSPVVAALAHESCTVSGHAYSAGGGRVARFFIGLTPGWTKHGARLEPEDVAQHLDEIDDPHGMLIPTTAVDDLKALRRALSEQQGAERS